MGIGTTAPDASAALEIVSSTKGLLLPRVANATAIASPAAGLLVYQTGGTPGFYYNAGTSGSPNWQQLATASGAAVTASNGLTKTGNDVALGGTLTGATTLANGGFPLNVTGSGFTSFGANVGIGTTAPATQLGVKGAGSGYPATSGTAQSAGHIARFADNSNLALDLGGAGSFGVWLQSTDVSALSLNYPLLLNPNGGNVGLGTTAPGGKLDIAGGADSNGANDPTALAFQYRLGGYRHFVRSRHNSGLGSGGNDLDFYLNNSGTAAGSSAAGTGNTQVLTLESYAGAPPRGHRHHGSARRPRRGRGRQLPHRRCQQRQPAERVSARPPVPGPF